MTVLEVLKFQVAYVPSVEEGSSDDIVQRNNGLLLMVLTILMVILPYTIYALAGQER